MKQRKTLSTWLTTRLLLIIRDEDMFAEKATIRFNYARLLLFLGGVFAGLLFLCFFLVTTLLSRWFDPRVEQLNAAQRLIELEQKVDSLKLQAELKDKYILNIRNILEGKLQVENSQEKQAVNKPSDVDLKRLSPIDSAFRKEFEGADEDKLSIQVDDRASKDIQQLFLFSPTSGVISRRFSVKDLHFGVDIVTQKDEPVKCIADGTVIVSSWTQDAGYVIAVQHKNNIISFYKHNAVLLKKVGETARVGDILAIVGNSGEMTDGPHLHFELWYNGNPINPQDYIGFE
jgi:murein DD-endopeptidase MepM/ murein hydrolase activator NlpD